MWSWSPLICAGKAPLRGSGYMELRENMCILILPFFLLQTLLLFKNWCLQLLIVSVLIVTCVAVLLPLLLLLFLFIHLFIFFFVNLFIDLFCRFDRYFYLFCCCCHRYCCFCCWSHRCLLFVCSYCCC